MRISEADSSGVELNKGPVRAKAFASGKVILFGEHAVVHGCPAIAAPLEKGVQAEVIPNSSSAVSVHAEGEVSPILPEAAESCVRGFGIQGADVVFGGDLPRSVGLGSSAALSVALVRACAQAVGRTLSEAEALSRAMEVEKAFHGNPSGLDHTVSFTGRMLLFSRNAPYRALSLPGRLEAVIWVVSPRGSAKERIARIGEMARADPGRVENIFRTIRGLTEGAARDLEKGDFAAVGEAMNRNHDCLAALDLSTPALDEACRRLRSLGAFGAKLTGAGGGGAVVALCEDASRVASKLCVPENIAFPVHWNPAPAANN